MVRFAFLFQIGVDLKILYNYHNINMMPFNDNVVCREYNSFDNSLLNLLILETNMPIIEIIF